MNTLTLKLNELKSFRHIPPNVEEIYQKESAQKNSITLKLLAIVMIFVELFNINRVLFLSNAGLSTLNNRIYFTMYVILLASAIIFNAIEWLLKNKEIERMRLYVVICYVWMLWHVVLNCYDLSRRQNGDITIFSCAVLVLAIFAQIKPRHTLKIIAFAYLTLLLLSGGALDAGGYINATISLILACLVAVRVYVLSIVQINQHIEIDQQSKQLQAEQAELNDSLTKYELLLNNTNDQIFEINFLENSLSFAKHSRFAQRFGTEIANVTEWLQTQTVIYPEYANQLMEGMQELITTTRDGDYTFPIHTEEGADRWYRLRLFVTRNHDAAAIHGLGIITDIDAQYRQVETLTSQTKIDPMTKLLNTVAFQQDYEIALTNLGETEYLVMFMLDLDNFKAINDTYGHFAGDCVLKEVANVLRTTFRNYDACARLGGDEFAIIMKNVKSINIIDSKAAQLARALSLIEATEEKIRVSCSIGIAVANHEHTNYDELYKCADKALYEAKHAGKGCYKTSQLM